MSIIEQINFKELYELEDYLMSVFYNYIIPIFENN